MLVLSKIKSLDCFDKIKNRPARSYFLKINWRDYHNWDIISPDYSVYLYPPRHDVKDRTLSHFNMLWIISTSLGKSIRIGGSQDVTWYYARVNDTEQTSKILQTEDVEFLFQFKTAQLPLFQWSSLTSCFWSYLSDFQIKH